MPSDFVQRRPQQRQRTLADLLRELEGGAPVRPAHNTSPVAGPGRLRQQTRAAGKPKNELDKRRKAAQEALRQLKEV